MRFRNHDDIQRTQDYEFDDGSFAHSTWYDVAGEEAGAEEPQAFIVDFRSGPGGTAIEPHFHHIRQFQVVIEGEGARIGKHPASPISFHYTDPDSPYGPIVPGADGRVAFFTLRPRPANGLYYMPSSRDAMKGRAGRNLLHNLTPAAPPSVGREVRELIEPHDDGLAAFRLLLAPGAPVEISAPTSSGGQFLLICDGSLRDGGTQLGGLAVGWGAAGEPAPKLVAGEAGADVLVLRFPLATELEDAALAAERGATTNVHGDGPRRIDVPTPAQV